ncbi:MAG: hypothetical protein JW757_03925 [Anaerolineales bacterium]|nr:hypothetical protein [Anaerolineales bacterium]
MKPTLKHFSNVYWIIGLFIVLIVVAGIVFLFFTPLVPDRISVIDRETLVILASPLENSQWPTDAFVPLDVIILGQKEIKSLELWVDGSLVETRSSSKNSEGEFPFSQWRWLPLSIGRHDLVVRAHFQDGTAANSNVVHLQAIEPAGFIALDPAQSDSSSPTVVEVYYPNLFPPNIDSPNQETPIQTGQSASNPPVSRFPLWLDQIVPGADDPPEAPLLSYATEGCTAKLIISDHSDNEVGFLVYKAENGSPNFQQVGAFGHNNKPEPVFFSQPDQTGPVQYYVTAFNGSGENSSNPVSIEFDHPACSTTDHSGLALDGENLVLSGSFQAAYFYYAVNRGAYQRYPAIPNTFLTPNENRINLSSFLDALRTNWSDVIKTLDLEVWGWQSGTLIEIGKLHLKLDYTELSICNLGTDCSGDVGSSFQSNYGEIVIDSGEQTRRFYWQSNLEGTTGYLWQIASTPFYGNFNPSPQNLVAAGCTDEGLTGSFLVDFSNLDEYLPAPATCDSNRLSLIQAHLNPYSLAYKPDLPTILYARITPLFAGQPVGNPSNTVEIRFAPAGDPLEPVILDHLPNHFQVEIESFEPIDFADPNYWGCVYITGIDYDVLWQSYRNSYAATYSDSQITELVNQLYGALHHAMENHLAVCPSPYQEEASSVFEEWGAMFMEGLGELWNTIVSAFNEIKAGLVELAAEVINSLGFECNQTCKDGLMQGLEIGIMYFTGIPPDLPNYEELTEMGIDYAIELAAAEAGVPCPEACKQALRDGLEQVVESVKKTKNQPGCVSAGYAQAMGKNPFCPPPGVDTQAVQEGLVVPAMAQIKITRTTGGDEVPYSFADQPAYAVKLTVSVSNPNLSGKTLQYHYSYNVQRPLVDPEVSTLPLSDILPGVSDSGQFYLSVPISGEINGEAFLGQSIAIPPLKQGESITIPISLQPTTFNYVIPQHAIELIKELESRDLTLEDVGGFSGYGAGGSPTDWNCLYKSGQIKVEAEIVCLSMPAGLIGQTTPDATSELVSCGFTAEPWIVWEGSAACIP